VTGDFASEQGVDEKTANSWLNVLVSSRVAVPEGDERFVSLVAMLSRGAPGEQPMSVEIRPYGAPGMPS